MRVRVRAGDLRSLNYNIVKTTEFGSCMEREEQLSDSTSLFLSPSLFLCPANRMDHLIICITWSKIGTVRNKIIEIITCYKDE